MRNLINWFGRLLFDRSDPKEKYGDMHPDILANDSWNKESSITFIFDSFNNRLYTEPYPNFHQDMIHKSGLGRQLLGDDYDPGGKVNPRTGAISTGTGRYDLVDRGYVLGRFSFVGAFRKIPAIAIWNQEKVHIKSALTAIVKEYPHLLTDTTLVKQEGSELGLLRDYQIE